MRLTRAQKVFLVFEVLSLHVEETYPSSTLLLFAQKIVDYFEGNINEVAQQQIPVASAYFSTEVDIAFDKLKYEIFFVEGHVNNLTEMNDYDQMDLEAFRLINLCVADRFRRC